jgi:hypothetical protein
MITLEQVCRLYSCEVYGRDGEIIGTVGQVWDDGVGQPSWAAIRTGRFGADESVVPLREAELREQRLVVPFSTTTVTRAPKVSASRDAPLRRDDVVRLCRHYRLRREDISPAYHTELATNPAFRAAGRRRQRSARNAGTNLRQFPGGILLRV